MTILHSGLTQPYGDSSAKAEGEDGLLAARLAFLENAYENACGMEICECGSDAPRPATKAGAAVRLATAFSFAAYQFFIPLASSSIDQADRQAMAKPAYAQFMALVRGYQWDKGMLRLGFSTTERQRRVMIAETAIMNHAARPPGFGWADLGAAGCLPGPGSTHKADDKGCHAVLQRSRKKGGLADFGLDKL